MTAVDWTEYRKITLTRMRAKWATMSDALRNLPTYVFQDPKTFETITVSPTQALLEVENLSDMGKKIIAAEISKIQKMQP